MAAWCSSAGPPPAAPHTPVRRPPRARAQDAAAGPLGDELVRRRGLRGGVDHGVQPRLDHPVRELGQAARVRMRRRQGERLRRRVRGRARRRRGHAQPRRAAAQRAAPATPAPSRRRRRRHGGLALAAPPPLLRSLLRPEKSCMAGLLAAAPCCSGTRARLRVVGERAVAASNEQLSSRLCGAARAACARRGQCAIVKRSKAGRAPPFASLIEQIFKSRVRDAWQAT